MMVLRIAFNVSTAGNYAAWPDIRLYDIRVCVDHCNDTMTDDRIVTPAFDSDVEGEVDSNGFVIDVSGYQTVNIFDAYCIPDPQYAGDIASAVLDQDFTEFEESLNALTDEISLAISDAQTAWMLFVIRYGIQCVYMYMYTYKPSIFLRLCHCCLSLHNL